MEGYEMKDYYVIIPYVREGAQGNELAYAVEGWQRHFKEKFRIVLVGDYHRVVERYDNMIFIACPRIDRESVESGMYLPNLDVAHKLDVVFSTLSAKEEFIFANDDCYALRDFDISDIASPKANAVTFRGNPESKGWGGASYRTRQLLDSLSAPAVNYSTHLPYLFNWDLYRSMSEKFDLLHKDYVRENLYYNLNQDVAPVLLDNATDNIRLGVWNAGASLRELTDRAAGKIWLVNSEEGWNLTLKDYLDQVYGNN